MTTSNLLIALAIVIVLVLVIAGVWLLVRSHRQSDKSRDGAESGLSSSARQTSSVMESSSGKRGTAEERSQSEEADSANRPESLAATSPVSPEETGGPALSSPDQEGVQEPESSASRMTRLRARLAKSPNPFGKALFSILSKDHLSESDWEEVEDTLLMADVGAEASEQLVSQLRSDARVRGERDPRAVRAGLRKRLIELVDPSMDRTLAADTPNVNKPSVIIMVGVNGSGKTTTVGKLARLFVAEGKSVVLGAADTFRAAAADQLETWGSKVGVPVVRSKREGADPASVAFEASVRAGELNADVLIVDTAGRLQNKANLMDQLGKIRRVIEKNLPVDEVLLVLDATTGQNGLIQARVFAEAIGITGIVLTKLDGSAKGGIVISVQRELGVPVKLVGLGEGPDDLSPFNPEAFVDGILGAD